MKQHIEVTQSNELGDKAKERLRGWWRPQVGDFWNDDGYERCVDSDYKQGIYDNPLLSIGQMIEFLDENKEEFDVIYKTRNEWGVGSYERDGYNGDFIYSFVEYCDELCDALWEAVKDTLEKE